LLNQIQTLEEALEEKTVGGIQVMVIRVVTVQFQMVSQLYFTISLSMYIILLLYSHV
jgi:hypothetical protein